jgi:hypothetical protein
MRRREIEFGWLHARRFLRLYRLFLLLQRGRDLDVDFVVHEVPQRRHVELASFQASLGDHPRAAIRRRSCLRLRLERDVQGHGARDAVHGEIAVERGAVLAKGFDRPARETDFPENAHVEEAASLQFRFKGIGGKARRFDDGFDGALLRRAPVEMKHAVQVREAARLRGKSDIIGEVHIRVLVVEAVDPPRALSGEGG